MFSRFFILGWGWFWACCFAEFRLEECPESPHSSSQHPQGQGACWSVHAHDPVWSWVLRGTATCNMPGSWNSFLCWPVCNVQGEFLQPHLLGVLAFFSARLVRSDYVLDGSKTKLVWVLSLLRDTCIHYSVSNENCIIMQCNSGVT